MSVKPARLRSGIVAALAILVIAALLGKNLIAKAAVINGVRLVTGLKLRMRDLDVGVLKSRLRVSELQVLNPAEFFQDEVMADLPEIYVDYDLRGFLKGRAHLEEVRLNLRELVVVRNETGAVNLNALQAVKTSRSGEAATPPRKATKISRAPALKIDVLELAIGRVVYKDYSGGAPQIRVFPVNLNERFTNITNPAVVGGLVVSRALANTTIARLADFDLKSLEQGVSQIMRREMGTLGDALTEITSQDTLRSAGKAAGQAVSGTGEAVKETAEAIKQLFGK
jgi:hypothetical protein